MAVCEDGVVNGHARVPARSPALQTFARSLQLTDQVALEATGNALAIAELIRPHVARVVIANAAAMKGIGGFRAKTDRLDAKTLAQLLAAGFLPSIWPGDETTRLGLRWISSRAQLARERPDRRTRSRPCSTATWPSDPRHRICST